ncbi:LysR family transcriptional regulator [Ectobacillus sp. JY-23]|uniref:LysR family transcriptional regulator n=1 Tax=Ectobacillus sp. JY-23 TaxID=2933872 RepID=UPI001FF516AE|nr:LysR family transcriptional regulator [Ectobacillus sp. JY-23]UOY93357.1 LysR family transcriptional regulator [Ectobacillus sp. JY-23]
MEIRHLITFKTIAELGGFTRAATHLGYAQSTMTAHIHALEQELKAPLFDRMGKKVYLTAMGERFLRHAREMIRLYEQAKDMSEQEEEGTLCIGAPESLTIYRLPRIIQTYRERYPRVNILLKSGSCWDLQAQLRRGELDVAFFLQAPFTDHELYTETLVDEKLMFILPPGTKLAEHENVLFTEKGSYRDYFEAFLRRQGIATENGMEFWSIEAIKQCVACGLGMSLLPFVTVHAELIEGKLAGQAWDPSFGTVSTIMSHHKEKWVSQAAAAFMEIVRTHAEAWRSDEKQYSLKHDRDLD